MEINSRMMELEARVAELTALVEQLSAPPPATPAIVEQAMAEKAAVEAPRTASRRGMLKLAGAAAAGTAAAIATSALPTAASDGQSLIASGNVDTTPTSRSTTSLTYRNAATPYVGILGVTQTDNANLFLARDENSSGSIFDSGSSFPAAVAGYSYRTVANGVYGWTGMSGAGVVAFGGGAGSVGLYALGNRCNISLNAAGAAPSLRFDAHVPGEVVCDIAGDVWVCTEAGEPGTWRKVAGAATSGSLHLLAAPKRVYDSRPGQLPATAPKTPLSGATRTIDCTLNSSGVPARAAGLVLNITASAISASGYLSVSPGLTGFSGTSTLNWGSAGAVVANSVTVRTGSADPARIDVTAGGGGNADFIVDVFGYYR